MADFPLSSLQVRYRQPRRRALSEPIACQGQFTANIYVLSLIFVQAYMHLFTSPSSAHKADENEDDQQPAAKRIRKTLAPTRSNVASLIGLRAVTGRSIAYTATQVSNIVLHGLSQCLDHVSFALHSRIQDRGAMSISISIMTLSTQPSSTISRTSRVQLPKLESTNCWLGGTRGSVL